MLTFRKDILLEQIDNKSKKVQTITTPVCNVKLSNEIDTFNLEVGGFKSFAFYNHSRERQFRIDKFNKRNREFEKQIKRLSYRCIGEELPSLVELSGKEGGIKT